ncbi:hypothetical protein D9M72_618280 [compost metagenome]
MCRRHCTQHRVFRLVEQTPHFRQELTPGIRQKNALTDALKQQHAKLAFKILDLTADSTLREIKFIGGLRETAMPGRTFKRL